MLCSGEETVPKDNKDDKDDGESASKGNWTIWITPGKEDGMGMNSNLSIEVYGEKGSSGVLPLMPHGDDKAKGEDECEHKKDEEKGSTEEKDVDNEDTDKTDENSMHDMTYPPGCIKDFNVSI